MHAEAILFLKRDCFLPWLADPGGFYGFELTQNGEKLNR
jgi:hypothetical protein